MKLWDLIVIGVIKMCTKFRGEIARKFLFYENQYWKSHGIVGVYMVNYGFLLFLRGKSRVFMGIMGYIMVY